MPGIRLKENEPFEVAIRRFKRTIEKAGTLTELRSREPGFDPRLFRHRRFAAGNLAIGALFLAVTAQILFGNLYLQGAAGDINPRVVGGLDGYTSGYNICTRTRSLDAIPFAHRLVFDMESSFGTDIRNPWNLLGYSVTTFWYAKPGATHNRPPQPALAAKPIHSVEDLKKMSEAIRQRHGPSPATRQAE